MPAARNSQSSFERGLAVLAAVAENGEVTVEHLSHELALPVSTIYRYVRTLRDFAIIEEQDGHYVPGWRLLEMSGRHLTHTRLAEIGFAVLRDVVEATSETAVLTVRVGAQALCLRQVESPRAIRYAFKINQLLPLHAGAGQRVLLAYAPPAVVVRVADGPLERYTARTLDRGSLLRDLEQIRRAGSATSHGEFNVGAVAAAVPVFAGGEVIASLTVAGPESRCGGKRWPSNAKVALRKAAEMLGEALEEHRAPAGR